MERIGSTVEDEKTVALLNCYIAISHQGNAMKFGGPRYGFAWEMRDANDKRLANNDNDTGGGIGYASKGLFESLLEIAKTAAPGSRLVIISTSEYFINLLCVWDDLRARRFLKPNGRKPYADTEAMRKVDAILHQKTITIVGKRPTGDEVSRQNFLQGCASEISANIGNDPGSRNT